MILGCESFGSKENSKSLHIFEVYVTLFNAAICFFPFTVHSTRQIEPCSPCPIFSKIFMFLLFFFIERSNQRKRASILLYKLILFGMKNMTTLTNKNQFMIICQECGYFPLQRELQDCAFDKNLFNLQWLCQCCKKTNTCDTDQYFRTYISSTCFLIDQTHNNQKQIILYIDASQQMAEVYASFSGNTINKKNGINKKIIIEESYLLQKYLQVRGMELKLIQGKYFSWQNFMKQRKLSKMQYAFWVADYLKKNIKKIIIKYFILDDELPYLNQLFFKKIKEDEQKNQNKQNIRKLKQNICSIQDIAIDITQKHQVIIISASYIQQNLKSIIQQLDYNDISKIVLINLQQQTDPITLQPTTTGLLIQNYLISQHLQPKQNKFQQQIYHNQSHNNFVSLLDIRMQQIRSQRQFLTLIKQTIKSINNYICIFTNKISNNRINLNMQKDWQILVQKYQYNNFIANKRKQTNSATRSKIFTNQRDKIQQILSQFRILTHKNIIDKQFLQQFINTVIMNVGKNYDIRVHMKINLFTNQGIIQKTILWQNGKFQTIKTTNTINQKQQSQYQYLVSNEQYDNKNEQINYINRYQNQELYIYI